MAGWRPGSLLYVAGWDTVGHDARGAATGSERTGERDAERNRGDTVEERERIDRARRVVRRAAHLRMAELGLTQIELAERAGLAPKTVSRFFNSDTWRDAITIRAISEALDWGPDELEHLVDREIARDVLVDLERQSGGMLVLQLGDEVLSGLTDAEYAELRATLKAVALRTVGEMRARTPGRDVAALSRLAAVGA